MRMLKPILDLKKADYESKEYFQFFIDSDLQVSNDDVARTDDNEQDDINQDDNFFADDEVPEFITFNTFLP